MWYIERTINKDIYYWKQNNVNTLWGSLFDGYWTKDPNSRYLFKDFRKAEKIKNKLKKYTLSIHSIHIRIRYLRNY